MTLRSNLADAARRAFVAVSRGTLVKADDSKKWQEATVIGEVKRKFTNVEVAYPYGYTAVAKPPADSQTSEAAEVIIVFPDGDMSHPIVIAIGDRRYRLKGLQEGEVAIYDDLGQKVHLTRNGILVDAGPAKKTIKAVCDVGKVVIAKDHVQLKKAGDTSLHVTVDIAGGNLIAGKIWSIGPDPYPGD